MASTLTVADTARNNRTGFIFACRTISSRLTFAKPCWMITRAVVVTLEPSSRVRTMPEAAIETEEVALALADRFLSCALSDTLALSTACGSGELAMSDTKGTGAHLTSRTKVSGMAAAFPCVEVADSTDFVRSPIKLVVAHIIPSCAVKALNMVIYVKNFIVCIPFTAHVIIMLEWGIVILPLTLDTITHEPRRGGHRTSFEFTILPSVRW